MSEYWDRGKALSMAMEEMDWPEHDQSLLEWYLDRLGLNRFLLVWQDQSHANDSRPPKSKYRAFRARLSRALGQNRVFDAQTPQK